MRQQSPQNWSRNSGDPDYLTAEEVANRYRLTCSALYTQRHRGEAPGSLGVKVGRKLLFRVSELDAWWDQEKLGALK